jgi:spore maturation protein CgeB
MPDLRVLFVGDTWKGSFARALREALDGQPSVLLDEIDRDHYLPPYRSLVLRAANRLLRGMQVAELEKEIRGRLEKQVPDVLMVYKGWGVRRTILEQAKAAGALVVNVFPDCSPHAHGRALRHAMGAYDLVISTKPFHPAAWRRIYGYSNPCVFVPHGYNPAVHYFADPPTCQELDVVIAATWRPEYHALVQSFALQNRDLPLRVAVAGAGWQRRHRDFPPTWQFIPSVTGRQYGEFLRSGRIAIAPVQREVVIAGIRQPGDEDTTRTYELAAAHCFMLHQRTAYVQTIFDESREVPMWDDATELAALVRYYLPRDDERRAMATAAHARAVPDYSVSNRAKRVLEHIRAALVTRDAVPA